MRIIGLLIVALGFFSGPAYGQLDLWQDRVVQIMNPYAKQLGLQGINISRTSEYSNNFGSVEVRNQYIEISIGSEVRTSHPGLSDDAMTYVLCHELGHVFAGPPLYKNGLSTEGQSDYWAAAVCLKKVFRMYPEAQVQKPHSLIQTHCDQQYAKMEDRILCYRIAQAGMDFMTEVHLGLAKLGQGDANGFYRRPDFSNKETYFSDGYPTLQCRTETIAAGAFCNTSEKRWILRAPNWACETPIAARPSCWFKK